jgi:hypothetical protein
MKILASGCSFTAGWPGIGENWACSINKRSYVNNIGVSGAGNSFINQSITYELVDKPNFYDIVLVMWSGLQRVDLPLSKETYRLLEHSKHKVNDHYWGLVGDVVSHAHQPEQVLKSFGKDYFSLTDEETLGCQSLLNMISLQNFLKAQSIPYRFMSYVNYWNSKDQVTNLNFGIYKYESCSKLAKQLDFSNFLFYNDNQDGFYEFAVQQNLIDLDNFHPNLQAHREWGAWINERIREKI